MTTGKTEQDNNIELQCPSCGTTVIWNQDFPHRPFCSKRCKQVDFGDWAMEKNHIAGNSMYDDILSGDIDGDKDFL